MKELNEKELMVVDGGGIDPVSLGVGVGAGILVEGATKAATGKTASDHVANGINSAIDTNGEPEHFQGNYSAL